MYRRGCSVFSGRHWTCARLKRIQTRYGVLYLIETSRALSPIEPLGSSILGASSLIGEFMNLGLAALPRLEHLEDCASGDVNAEFGAVHVMVDGYIKVVRSLSSGLFLVIAHSPSPSSTSSARMARRSLNIYTSA